MKTLAFILSLCALSAAVPTVENADITHQSSTIPSTAHLIRQYGVFCTGHTCGTTDNARHARSVKYLSSVLLGKKSFLVEIDTGSSNFWLIEKGFTCYPIGQSVRNITASSKPQPESHCNFGPTWKPDPSYKIIPDILDYVSYGGEGAATRDLAGSLGYHQLSFMGFQMDNAIVGAMNLSSFPAQGQPIQSGLMGMGFSALAGAFNMTAKDVYKYNSTMEILFNGHPDVPKQFALALSRDRSDLGYGGSLTVGGLPNTYDPRVNASVDISATTTMLQVNEDATSLDPDGRLLYYLMNVTSFEVGGESYDAETTVLVDSGNPGIQVPVDTFSAFNAAWSPAGYFSKQEGGWILDCDATNSAGFAVTINGTTFNINPYDLVTPLNDSSCVSAVALGFGTSPAAFVLGDTFMKNVVSVFDWGNTTMSFYAREYYEN